MSKLCKWKGKKTLLIKKNNKPSYTEINRLKKRREKEQTILIFDILIKNI